MNYPISGSLSSERLSAQPVLILDVDVTGMAITRISEEFTVLVITTDDGELVKASIFDFISFIIDIHSSPIGNHLEYSSIEPLKDDQYNIIAVIPLGNG